MDLDRLLIELIISGKKLEPVIEAGVTLDDIEDADIRRAMAFVFDYHANPKYQGTVPPLQTMRREFSDLKLGAKVSEKIEYVLDQIVERSEYNLVRDTMREVYELLEDPDHRAVKTRAGKVRKIPSTLKDNLKEVKAQLATASERLASRSARMRMVSVTDNADQRWERFVRRRDGSSQYGIPTGFPWIDRWTLGWQPSDLVLILAKRGVGKTWFGLISAMAAQLSGFRAMFISPEMDRAALEARYDALYAKVPYRALRRAELGKHLEEQYRSALKELKERHPLFIPEFDGPCTPLAIQALAREYKVDLVVIDGVYMLSPNPGDPASGWEKHAAVAANLKKDARMDRRRLLLTNQLNRISPADEADLDNSAYSDTYGQYCDVALKLVQGADERAAKEMLIHFLKMREDEKPERAHRILWNLDTMTFGELSSAEEEDADAVAVPPSDISY